MSSLQSHPSTPHSQSKPIKISGNESTKSSSSSTSAESSADSTDRLILTKQNTIIKAGTTSSSDDNADDFHYEAIVDPNVSKPKYAYHDEAHSFENSMEFLEDYKNFQYEVLETTV